MMLIGLMTALPSAEAAPPVVATQINVITVKTPDIVVPDTAGAPASFIVAGKSFDVDLTFTANGVLAPISANKAATITLTIPDGPADANLDPDVVGTKNVPAGVTSATVPGTLPQAANGVVVTASATIQNKPVPDLKPGKSLGLDPQKAFVSRPKSTLTSIGSADPGVPCTATPSQPICADLLLPNQDGVLSNNVLLSLGACPVIGPGRCPANSSVVQALVDLGPAYDATHPMTLVFKCDKTQCPGGAINSYQLNVKLTYAPEDEDPTKTAPPCASKGVIQAGTHFCLDYVQSTRDNAGDTILFLLLDRDLRTQGP